MKHLALVLLLILFVFASCKKKEIDFEFSGNVKAPVSGLNVENAKVKFYTYSSGNNIESLKGSTKTDASGNYEIKIERSKFETLVIKVSKDNYFTEERTFPIDNLTTAKTNEVSHSLSPKSWTRLFLKNNAPTEFDDELKIQKVSGKTDCEGCWPNANYIFKGSLDTVIYIPNDGGTTLSFYWWTKGSTVSDGLANIHTTPFDTVDYSIIY